MSLFSFTVGGIGIGFLGVAAWGVVAALLALRFSWFVRLALLVLVTAEFYLPNGEYPEYCSEVSDEYIEAHLRFALYMCVGFLYGSYDVLFKRWVPVVWLKWVLVFASLLIAAGAFTLFFMGGVRAGFC